MADNQPVYVAAGELASGADAVSGAIAAARKLARQDEITPEQFTQGISLRVPDMQFMYGKRLSKRPKKPKIVKVFCTKNMYGVIVSKDETEAMYYAGEGLEAEDLSAFAA